jgi:hypothetical protein
VILCEIAKKEVIECKSISKTDIFDILKLEKMESILLDYRET